MSEVIIDTPSSKAPLHNRKWVQRLAKWSQRLAWITLGLLFISTISAVILIVYPAGDLPNYDHLPGFEKTVWDYLLYYGNLLHTLFGPLLIMIAFLIIATVLPQLLELHDQIQIRLQVKKQTKVFSSRKRM